ncbi:MAG: hypothetical protein QOC80_616 [Frankiaceae bacterium]|jgi:hypothetical protein|nr:hypothetical protein [Frankiaceae bacterium]
MKSRVAKAALAAVLFGAGLGGVQGAEPALAQTCAGHNSGNGGWAQCTAETPGHVRVWFYCIRVTNGAVYEVDGPRVNNPGKSWDHCIPGDTRKGDAGFDLG